MTFFVVTANFGSYDLPSPISFKSDCKFLYFTDNEDLKVQGWDILCIKLDLNHQDSNRYIKIKLHEFLDPGSVSMYLDSNIQLLSDPFLLIKKYIRISDLSAPKHRYRTCAYEEGKECIRIGKADITETRVQLNRYEAEGFPYNYGLTENGILIRRHSDTVNSLMCAWWNEYKGGVKRDQISLPYVCWKYGFKIYRMTESAFNKNPFFRYALHSKDKRDGIVGRIKDYFLVRKHRGFFYNALHKLNAILINK